MQSRERDEWLLSVLKASYDHVTKKQRIIMTNYNLLCFSSKQDYSSGFPNIGQKRKIFDYFQPLNVSYNQSIFSRLIWSCLVWLTGLIDRHCTWWNKAKQELGEFSLWRLSMIHESQGQIAGLCTWQVYLILIHNLVVKQQTSSHS